VVEVKFDLLDQLLRQIGKGFVGVAAKLLNRKFYGNDINLEAIKIATDRLKQAV